MFVVIAGCDQIEVIGGFEDEGAAIDFAASDWRNPEVYPVHMNPTVADIPARKRRWVLATWTNIVPHEGLSRASVAFSYSDPKEGMLLEKSSHDTTWTAKVWTSYGEDERMQDVDARVALALEAELLRMGIIGPEGTGAALAESDARARELTIASQGVPLEAPDVAWARLAWTHFMVPGVTPLQPGEFTERLSRGGDDAMPSFLAWAGGSYEILSWCKEGRYFPLGYVIKVTLEGQEPRSTMTSGGYMSAWQAAQILRKAARAGVLS